MAKSKNAQTTAPATPKSKASDRKKFGQCGGPIKATRVLAKDMPHFAENGIEAKSLIIINDNAGTFTAANVYGAQNATLADGGHLGKNYDPSVMTHPLPAEGDQKWKDWAKKGYEDAQISDFDILEAEEVAAKSETETATA